MTTRTQAYAELLTGSVTGLVFFPLRLLAPLLWALAWTGEWSSFWSNSEGAGWFLGVSCFSWAVCSPALILIGWFIAAGLGTLAQIAARNALTKREILGVATVAGITIGILIEGIRSILCPADPIWPDLGWLDPKITGAIISVTVGGVLGLVIGSIQVLYGSTGAPPVLLDVKDARRAAHL